MSEVKKILDAWDAQPKERPAKEAAEDAQEIQLGTSTTRGDYEILHWLRHGWMHEWVVLRDVWEKIESEQQEANRELTATEQMRVQEARARKLYEWKEELAKSRTEPVRSIDHLREKEKHRKTRYRK